MHFGENQLSLSLIGLSPLSTGHPKAFQRLPVRSSSGFYPAFNLPMDRSLSFGSAATDLTPCSDSLSLRLRISPESSHRRGGLAPRCRLIASWGWSRSQGYGCSPFKAVRELGSERRETVRSLSAVGVGRLRRADPSTRGPGWTCHWCTSCPAKGSAG